MNLIHGILIPLGFIYEFNTWDFDKHGMYDMHMICMICT
ncbi:hypothetical protein F383_37904 [Gossypium arboreum]|uniref:Uncharacterized protein n=1 Tax=Gossypium arboreum TaxID=29729 RepID=A0A0B0MI02_GOSAR|nr:hypothetical protein F383_37904 [Gossypium arboreum]